MPATKATQSDTVTWKVVNLFMTLLFTLFTYVQKNDPDSAIWMAVYFITAMLCFVIVVSNGATDDPLWRVASMHHIIVIIAFCAYSVKIISEMKSDLKLYELEEARELGGLFFALVWLLICRNSNRLSKKHLVIGTVVVGVLPIALWIGIYLSQEYRAVIPEHCKTVMYADPD